jgi:hypothetical protein
MLFEVQPTDETAVAGRFVVFARMATVSAAAS